LAILRPLPAFQLLLALLIGLWASSALFSQDTPSKPAGTAAEAQSKAGVDEPRANDPLRILWLKNPATGELVPVPGLTIDEYDKLDRIRRGLPPESATPPNFVVTDLRLTAQVKGMHSVCELALEVELRDDQWARIPLGLTKAVVRSAPSEEHWLVAPDSTSDGLVLWAKGRAGEKKSLKLPFMYPIAGGADSSKLQLALPRARTSGAKITIESEEIIPELEGAGTIDATRRTGAITEIECSGFSSVIDLFWRPKVSSSQKESWLESVGAVEVHVDGRRQIRVDARFRIRTFGLLPQPLRIRLPDRMRLAPDAAPISPFVRSQTVTPSASQATPKQQVLELVIDPAVPSDFEIRIQVESDGPIAPEASNLSIANFELLDAKRHGGVIDLFLTSDWYVAAEQPPGIRRIDNDAGAAADASFSRARFEYASQPAVLQISARLPRTLVEPSYDIFLEASQARLEGMLKYRFRGPSTGRIEIDLADWELNRLDSPDSAFILEDAEQVGSRLVIPLSPQQASASAESTLRIELRRPISARPAQIQIPHPAASVDASAIVRVFSDANLEISPRAVDFKGVSIDSSLPSSAPQLRGQFGYRTRPGGESPLLAFDIEVRRQSLLLDVTTQLDLLSPRSVSVDHAMRMNVAYEALGELSLELPFPAKSVNTVRVLLDDLPLDCNDMVENEAADESGLVWTTCRYNLPRSYLGPLNLTVQFPFAAPEGKEGATKFAVPLPKLLTNSPVQSKPHQLVVRDATRRIQVDATEWSANLFEPAGPIAGSQRYFSLQGRSQVLLTIRETSRPSGGGNRCDRMWLQTTLDRTARNDRLCLRMSSWSAPLRIHLPDKPQTATVVVAIDGEEIEFENQLATAREIVIPPPRSRTNEAHVVETWYQCGRSELQWGSVLLEAPAVMGIETRGRHFWHLITPPDWYSVVNPAGWTMENNASLQDSLWGSNLSFDQSAMEKWCGASTQIAPPAEFNQYLFGALSPQPSLQIVLAPRRELWLIGLGSVFCVGAMLVYVSWLRRPIAMLTFACAAVLLLIFQPNWSTAVTQFVILGGTATLLVGLLKSLLGPTKAASSRAAPSRSSAPTLDSSALPSDSQSAPRRGSSIKGASVATGPAP
jgi:hypothetical protein